MGQAEFIISMLFILTLLDLSINLWTLFSSPIKSEHCVEFGGWSYYITFFRVSNSCEVFPEGVFSLHTGEDDSQERENA